MNHCKECGKETKNKVFCSNNCCTTWNNKHAMTDETQRKRGRKNREGLKIPKNILDMSKRTVSKVLNRLNVGCSRCGWKEASCDIHHILPRSKGGTDDHSNLTVLCPNCHRVAHNKKQFDFETVEKQIGERWREFYLAHE